MKRSRLFHAIVVLGASSVSGCQCFVPVTELQGSLRQDAGSKPEEAGTGVAAPYAGSLDAGSLDGGGADPCPAGCINAPPSGCVCIV